MRKIAKPRRASKVPIKNYVPAQDRPKWQADDESSDLLYLGWGRRYHGEDPPPPYRHPGWLYILLLSGSPNYLINGETIRPEKESFVIVHPECAFGANDKPSGCCTWLLWHWKNPPPEFLPIPHGGYRLLSPSKADVSHFKYIHGACRSEVSSPDGFTSEMLRSYRENLDISLARILTEQQKPATDNQRIELALNWLRLNPSLQQPVPALCEYLQISHATLYRLFLRQRNETPARCHQRMRLVWAREQMIKHQKSAKEMAYTLGYNHPGDFSRAYKKMFKASPIEDRRG